MTTRVRFAPSPTGYLHIGSARTALFNYLFARHTGGKFLLRIEDTDLQRSTEESTRSILDGLAWLGFQPDEEIVYQSKNAEKHRAAALKLLAEGKAYRDFTPKEEPSDKNVKQAIAEKARQQGADKNLRDNPYRNLSKEESDARAEAGEPFAIRLKVAETGKTSFEDAVYGLNERSYSETEDLVLLRSDGSPLYNLAVVVDDIEMGITHVIRGQDHINNTHKQILIYEALAAKKPEFAHLPLILAPGGKKLSKRIHGEIVSMTTYRDAGFLPEAFRNYLALLGWSPSGTKFTADAIGDNQKATAVNEDDSEIMTLDDLIRRFSLDRIHKSPAIFNFDANNPKRWTDDKALWINAQYIRHYLPIDDLVAYVKNELKANKLWRDEYEDGEREWFEDTVRLISERFFTLKDFSNQGRAFFSEDFDFDQTAIDKNLKKFPDLQTLLPELAERFETIDETDFTHDTIETAVKTFAEEKGVKLGQIMNGARALLTGLAVGPSMLAVFETLGKEKSIRRLKSQVAWNL